MKIYEWFFIYRKNKKSGEFQHDFISETEPIDTNEEDNSNQDYQNISNIFMIFYSRNEHTRTHKFWQLQKTRYTNKLIRMSSEGSSDIIFRI